MYLVAGLAAAGLAGIAAAFYFSIRSGRGGGRRLRSAGAGRVAAGRRGTARPGRPGDDRRDAYDARPARAGRAPGTRVAGARARGHQAGTRKAGPAASRSRGTQLDESPDTYPGAGPARTAGPRPGSRSAARLAGKTAQAAADEDGTRPRRRMGFRKGADVDEEMWPAEAFGGVSDEQFWDDLASDKPLTTTARTAQQDSETRKRPVDTGQATDPQMLRVTRARTDDRGREGKRAAATGGYPEARPAPDPATERTMIQPAYTATQPVPSMASQASGMTSQTSAMTSQTPASQSQPTAQPAETRVRRRPSSAEEDPLTSAAFALRTSGPVDGRSALRAAGSRPAGAGPGYGGAFPASPAAFHAAPYPSQRTSYGELSPAAEAMSTPPYGENYSRGAVPPGDDQRGPNGTRGHARHAGDGTRPVRQAYPQDSYPGSGQHGNGYLPGGYPGPGQRAPYDPRDDYRRLTHQH